VPRNASNTDVRVHGIEDWERGQGHRGEGYGDAQMAPTREEQNHLKTKRLRIMLTVTRRMSPRMFPASLVFPCPIPDERENAIGRRREHTERGRRHRTHHGFRIPLSRPDHAPRRPICQRERPGRLEPLERPLCLDRGSRRSVTHRRPENAALGRTESAS